MKEIRDALELSKRYSFEGKEVETIKDFKFILKTFQDLAEKVLAVGFGLSLEDTKTIIKRYFDKCGGVINYNDIAKAIHSAQMEKLGGK